MKWTHGLFVHWPIPAELLRPHVPAALELDTYEGQAWVSALPFVLSDAGLRFSPSFTRVTTPELNVRTYVRFEGSPGLFFISVDIGAPIIPTLVRGLTNVSCYHADMEVCCQSDPIKFNSTRQPPGAPSARFELSYRPAGEKFQAEPGTLDYWLAERRRFYQPTENVIRYAEVAHEPWPLQPADATIHANSLFERCGLPIPERAPRIRYCEQLEMTASFPRRIR